MNNISENFKLVQLLDSLGNVNHVVSVDDKFILIQDPKKLYRC